MVRILDKFYTSPQYIYEKGALCTLKRVNSEHIEFGENTHQPTIMLLSVDAVSEVDEDTLNDIIKNYKLCTGNKVVIDTTIEDFINFNFFKILIIINPFDRYKKYARQTTQSTMEAVFQGQTGRRDAQGARPQLLSADRAREQQPGRLRQAQGQIQEQDLHY